MSVCAALARPCTYERRGLPAPPGERAAALGRRRRGSQAPCGRTRSADTRSGGEGRDRGIDRLLGNAASPVPATVRLVSRGARPPSWLAVHRRRSVAVRRAHLPAGCCGFRNCYCSAITRTQLNTSAANFFNNIVYERIPRNSLFCNCITASVVFISAPDVTYICAKVVVISVQK